MRGGAETESPHRGEFGTELYLDLLKKCLTRYAFGETYQPIRRRHGLLGKAVNALQDVLSAGGLALVRRQQFNAQLRAEGRDWPLEAETMIGLRRLDNLEFCLKDVLRRGVLGDVIETGAWRGGASIFMRAVLKVWGDAERVVWVADSFEGLPKPNTASHAQDRGSILWRFPYLAVSLEAVKGNFARYDLLDDQVRFLVGWFKDTLPKAEIEQLAVLRLDADMYESTMDVLRFLYHKVSIGGYVIVDDYGGMDSCKAAVDDFRAQQTITEQLVPIDWTGVYWRRLR
jgi:O-methyltransferase